MKTKTQKKSKPESKKVETPIIESPKVETPIEEAKPEVKKSFMERMLDGLLAKEILGGRTLHVSNEDKDLKLEIIEGKLFNKGTLKEGWLVRTPSGDKGTLVKVDEGKAIMRMSSSLEHSISVRSELEILDPEVKDVREPKQETVKQDSPNIEGGDLKPTELKKAEPKKGAYTFDGKSYVSKSVLARDIVAKYASENPKATVAKMEEKFPAPFMGKFGLFKEVSEAKKISGTGLPRYSFKEDQLVSVGDKKVAVCNQITPDKMNSIIALAKTNGYEVITE